MSPSGYFKKKYFGILPWFQGRQKYLMSCLFKLIKSDWLSLVKWEKKDFAKLEQSKTPHISLAWLKNKQGIQNFKGINEY